MKTRKLLAALLSLALCVCSLSVGNSSPAIAECTAASVTTHDTSLTDTIDISKLSLPKESSVAKTTTATQKKPATTSVSTTKPPLPKTTASKTTAKSTASKTTTSTAKKTTASSTSTTKKTVTTTTTATTTEAPLMLGDINNDKIITGSDATLILTEYTILSGGAKSKLSAAQKIACDINKDGIITGSDATLTLTYYTYLSSGGVLLFEDFLRYGPIDIRVVTTTTTTTTTTSTTTTTTTTSSTSSSATIYSETTTTVSSSAETTSVSTTTTTTTTTAFSDPYTVQAIKLSKYEITVNVNQGDISMVTMLPQTAPDKSEKWWSSNPDIATVDYEGWIVGKSPGECIVTVQSVDNPDVTAEIKVTVIDNKVSEIKLDKYEITVGVGEGNISMVTMLPHTAPDKSEKWWSSNPDIATVDYEGWIVGKSPGECIVTVQSVNNPDVTAEIKVTVIDNKVSEIKLDKYEITVDVGEGDISMVTMLPQTAPDKSEKWWSSNPDIATVDYEGWIVGKSPGECIVTVQSVDNPDVTAEIKVIVTDNSVQEIKLDKYEVVLKVGMGDMPLVTMLPASAPDKSEIWKSSNTRIATVNFEGWIVGIAPGKCTVTVQSAANPDIKAEVKVIVIE